MKEKIIFISILLCMCIESVALDKGKSNDWINHAFSVSLIQAENMFKDVKKTSLLPRSIDKSLVNPHDWTSGFYPGMLWYLYEYSNDKAWKEKAIYATGLLEYEQYNAVNHDIGFKIFCSYGNGWRLTGDKNYKRIIIRSAKTLTSRYSYKTGLIMSWDPEEERGWKYPVIIDNMMNLELLMEAYKLSGDTTMQHIAISHADKTMKFHYRKDMSCPHLVDYDDETGKMRKFDWNNGSDDIKVSTWSRGQAWGLYGFTMMYRETKDKKYLEHAEKIADFILSHPNMPKDMIPYWDLSGVERSETRDASAAAIMASALMELSTYSSGNGKRYFENGEKMLKSLTSPEYLSKPGEHSNFIIKKAIGNYLRNSELKGGISYADYYFIEGLMRYIKITNNEKLF